MTRITELEFARIVDGIIEDRATIVKHNPVGTDEEILLWMLLSCLNSYLDLAEAETPCFNGKPDAATYRNAVKFVIDARREGEFDTDRYLDRLSSK